ncbi:hypothetical protein XA68_12644 [Ophiocordyceps unilateralis]|uniref:Uncharacterized protein n=1 Tax=Ophiocordyceps unilateralis TaxID=268505 RepID=A0A2A9PE86_OPHUN|nr:hypothetical protein XA68_12644 [Ophiocordyceps unilateralis]
MLNVMPGALNKGQHLKAITSRISENTHTLSFVGVHYSPRSLECRDGPDTQTPDHRSRSWAVPSFFFQARPCRLSTT